MLILDSMNYSRYSKLVKLHKKAILVAASILVAGGAGTGVIISSKTGDDMKNLSHDRQTENPQPVATASSDPVAEPKPSTVSAPKPTGQNPSSQTNNTPQPETHPQIYGEDSNFPGRFIVFDKTAAMDQAGIPTNAQQDADKLITHMSNWVYSWREYGKRDICWVTDTAITAGTDYYTNPVTQLKFCKNFVDNKYGGDWSAALADLKKPS